VVAGTTVTQEEKLKAHRFGVLLVPLALLLGSGCATIFTSSSDPITFKSVPEGAKVEINGASIGRTPVTVPIKRSLTPPQVQVKLDGYEAKNIMLQNSFNGVAILDVFFWPGFIIDAVTGAIMKYDVLNYEVELDPKQASVQVATPALAPVPAPVAPPAAALPSSSGVSTNQPAPVRVPESPK
jgi:hypothetical protein